MIIDTHCHLDQVPVELLKAEMLADHLYLCMSTSSDSWNRVIHLASQFDQIFPALGLHPWYVQKNYKDQIDSLSELLRLGSPSALGEIGLDFSDPYKAFKNEQLDALEQQLILATTYQLPVSLHVVKAHNEMFALLKRYSVSGVVHSLGSSIQVAQTYAEFGFKFGVNAILLRPNARRYHQLVTHFGLNALVLETDYPNIMCPGREESKLSDINQTVKMVADLTSESIDHVTEQTFVNANRIFNFT